MLGDKDVMATVAVRSLDGARGFYEGVLGLEPLGAAEMGVQAYRAGKATMMVYQSAFAGTNKATVLTWPLGGAFDAVVSALKAEGVTFEHYDLPDTRREGDVHISGGGMRIAWFKDPDGNIINIGDYPSQG